MLKSTTFTLAFLSLVLFGAQLHAQEDVEATIKQIVEKQASVKSLSASFETVMEMKMPGYSNSTRSQGTFAYRTPEGGERQSRIEQTSKGVTSVGGQETKSNSSMLSIDDGKLAWTLSETDGQKSAMKMKRTKVEGDAFEGWRKSGKLELLADEKVNGADTWVIKFVPEGGGSHTVMYYLKDSGFTAKSVSFGADGKPMTTTTYTDIKVNPALGDDLFAFAAPAGVAVTDLTGN